MKDGILTIPVDHQQKKLHTELQNWATKMKIRVIDPFTPLCPDDQCLIITQNGRFQVYVEHSHFNPDWVIENAGFIDKALLKGRL